MFTVDERLLRNGKPHKIGPLLLKFEHRGDGSPEGLCAVRTESDAVFQLDWMIAMAIGFCISPTADLWSAYDSDKEHQDGSGRKRGWFRLKATANPSKVRLNPAWAGEPFQVNRLVLNAVEGEVVRRRKGERTTDYRSTALVKVGGSAKTNTRAKFIQCCFELAQQVHGTPPRDWALEAKGRFAAADTLAGEIVRMNSGK